MTEIIVLGTIAAAACGAVALAVLVYTRANGYRRACERLTPEGSDRPGPQTQLEERFPLARYRPMFRLLAGEDTGFLQRDSRCPKVVEQWGRSQRRVARIYLKELAADFQTLHREARALVVLAPETCAGMVPLLIKLRISFWRARIWIELCLFLRGAGVSTINPAALVSAFETMQRELSRAAALAQNQPNLAGR